LELVSLGQVAFWSVPKLIMQLESSWAFYLKI